MHRRACPTPPANHHCPQAQSQVAIDHKFQATIYYLTFFVGVVLVLETQNWVSFQSIRPLLEHTEPKSYMVLESGLWVVYVDYGQHIVMTTNSWSFSQITREIPGG